MSTTWNESQHPRQGTGKFAAKSNPSPGQDVLVDDESDRALIRNGLPYRSWNVATSLVLRSDGLAVCRPEDGSWQGSSVRVIRAMVDGQLDHDGPLTADFVAWRGPEVDGEYRVVRGARLVARKGDNLVFERGDDRMVVNWRENLMALTF